MFLVSKKSIEKKKQEIITKQVDKMKRLILNSVIKNANNGIDKTTYEIPYDINSEFKNDIIKTVIEQLTNEHKNIEFKIENRIIVGCFSNNYQVIVAIVKE